MWSKKLFITGNFLCRPFHNFKLFAFAFVLLFEFTRFTQQRSPLTNVLQINYFHPGINFFEIEILNCSFFPFFGIFLPITDNAYIMVEVRVSKINSDDFPSVSELIQPH